MSSSVELDLRHGSPLGCAMRETVGLNPVTYLPILRLPTTKVSNNSTSCVSKTILARVFESMAVMSFLCMYPSAQYSVSKLASMLGSDPKWAGNVHVLCIIP